MAARMSEYVALTSRALHRSGWMAAHGGRGVMHMPLVVYNGRAKWNAPLRLENPEWVPEELRDLQPRLAYRLIDAKDYTGDDAADGNLARAALALDAASVEGLAQAFARAKALFAAANDQELWQSFIAWCGGTLGPRLGDQLLTLDNKEPTMLAETLREHDEMKIDEGRREGLRAGRREGRQEGMQAGRQEGMRAGRREGMRTGRQEGIRAGRREVLVEERALLCSQASRRFDAAIGAELAIFLAGVEDGAELARVGTLIIDCDSGSDFLARARRRGG